MGRTMGAARGAETAAAPVEAPAAPSPRADREKEVRTPRKRKVVLEKEATPATPRTPMANDAPSDTTPLANPLPRTACGGTFSKKTPVFSMDGKFVFCAAAYAVRVYSTVTGSLLQTLTGFEDTAVLTVAHNPSNAFQLYVAYKDGRISLWDFNDGVVLRTFSVGQPLRHFSLLASGDEAVIVTPNAGRDARDKAAEHERAGWRVYVATFKPSLQLTLAARLKDGQSFACDASGDLMAAVSKRSLSIVRRFNGQYEVVTVKHGTNLQIVAVNSAARIVAAGDASGCIYAWYLGADGNEPSVPTPFHWHSSGVHALTFSIDGSHMLSGGEEGVLVIWQLATRSRNFLPRLGSPLLSVSCSADGSLYALGMGDSSVRLVNTTGLVTRHTLVGVRQVSAATGGSLDFAHGMTRDPRRRCIVLNGLPGGIQFFSPWQDRHMGDVDVLHRNLVTRSDKGALSFPRIEHVAFSRGGEWMATVDHFEEEATQTEITLRFWHYDENAQAYSLRTRVDMPHSMRVTSLAFHPTLPLAVTAGNDKRFRLWQTETLERKGEAPMVSWVCRSVGFHRDMLLRDAVFSPDGSVLAVACGQLITLWDPLRNTLQATLCHSPPDEPVLQLAFLPRSAFLVARTKARLYVWNLLNCEVAWSVPSEARHVTVHPSRAVFLAVMRATDNVSEVAEYAATSPLPTRTWQVRGAPVRSLLFVDDSQFAMVDEAQRIFIAHPDTAEFIKGVEASVAAIEAGKDAVAAAAEATGGMMGRLTARRKEQTVEKDNKENEEREAVVSVPRGAPANDVLDAPAHTIPPLSRIFESFMSSLLPPPLVSEEPKVQAAPAATAAPTTKNGRDDDEDEDEDTMQVEADISKPPRRAVSKETTDMNFDFLVKFFRGVSTDGKPNGVAH